MGFLSEKGLWEKMFFKWDLVLSSKENVMTLMANGLNFESCPSKSTKQHHSCETQQEVWVWADL